MPEKYDYWRYAYNKVAAQAGWSNLSAEDKQRAILSAIDDELLEPDTPESRKALIPKSQEERMALMERMLFEFEGKSEASTQI